GPPGPGADPLRGHPQVAGTKAHAVEARREPDERRVAVPADGAQDRGHRALHGGARAGRAGQALTVAPPRRGAVAHRPHAVLAFSSARTRPEISSLRAW